MRLQTERLKRHSFKRLTSIGLISPRHKTESYTLNQRQLSSSPFLQPVNDACQKNHFSGIRAGATLFDQHLACAVPGVGAIDVVIVQIEVATRPDCIEYVRNKFSSVHLGIIAGAARL